MKKSFSLILFFAVILINTFSPLAAAEENAVGYTELQSQIVESSEQSNTDYESYISRYEAFAYADGDIKLEADNYRTASGFSPESITVSGRDNVISLDKKGASLLYDFTAERDSLYNLKINYIPLPGREMPITVSVKIDGEFCFAGMSSLTFPRIWKNSGDVRKDDKGNEYAPEQVEANIFTIQAAADTTGLLAEPYLFALSAGSHTVEIIAGSEPFALAEVIFCAPEENRKYDEVLAEYKKNGYQSPQTDPIVIEGEAAEYKTTRSLIPLATNGDPSVTPSNAFQSLVNYIGSVNWQSPGETLVWKFRAEKSGLYKIGFRYCQNGVENGDSYRWLKIDGKTPFAEAQSIAFGYDTAWRYEELGGEDPYCVYLEEGEHEISLSVTLGAMAEFIRRLDTIIGEIGNLYLKINMITGESVDANRNYDLFNQIPGFTETLETNSVALKTLAEDIEKSVGSKGGSYVAAIRDMAAVLDRMIKNPYTAHQYKSDYYSKYCTLTSWQNDVKALPLSLDEIIISPAQMQMTNMTKGFFARAGFSALRFFASFLSDYQAGSNQDSGDITIWINWGRDQAQVLSSLVRETFTPKTGISVNIKIVNATLVQAILSGKGPDCSLQMNRTEPVNLAMRGALYDLKQFDDYDEVITRFAEGAEIPYMFADGCYALPDTQNFNMLFYRTDIFNSLGITAPKTWEEFKEVSSVLMRNNLQISLPYTQITETTTVCGGVGALSLFPTLVLQNGLSLYSEDLSETTFTKSETLDVFTFWTDFYTEMRFPVQADFYNRFRIGLMPMGISGYTTYSLLKVAAPEITGRWAMTEIPGVVSEDGSVNNCEAGSGTGCAIMQMSENKQAAWEFLKWWTSAETQLRYSNNVESVLGVTGRIPTSNTEALKKLSWEDEDLEKLLTQWEAVQEVPEVPGSYYTARAVDQAYWNTVDQGKNPRDTMIKWGKKADEEIARKRREYNVR